MPRGRSGVAQRHVNNVSSQDSCLGERRGECREVSAQTMFEYSKQEGASGLLHVTSQNFALKVSLCREYKTRSYCLDSSPYLDLRRASSGISQVA